MSAPPVPSLIDGLHAIAPGYDALLCDVWGVVHNGRVAFDGVAACLERFRAERGPVFLLTNAPRPASVLPPQLARIGISEACYDGIVTSGDATHFELSRRAPGVVFHLGPDRDLGLFDGLELRQTSSVEEADFVLCSGLRDDVRETPADYQDELAAMQALGHTMVCANPDIQVVRGSDLIYCAGALAEAYRAIGGEVAYCGKPHGPIYDLAMRRIEAVRPGISRDRVLAVGDGPKTDVRGANRQGIDCLFILGGIHARDMAGKSPSEHRAALTKLFETERVHAAAVLPSLIW
ncbi:MAG: TIGR01459 family HAD-type hydrolase [Pseudomonadota bacterium]